MLSAKQIEKLMEVKEVVAPGIAEAKELGLKLGRNLGGEVCKKGMSIRDADAIVTTFIEALSDGIEQGMKEEMFKEPAAPQNAPIEASKPSPSPTLPWVSAPIKMPLPDLPKVGDVVKCRDCGVVYRALSYRTTQACMECDSKYIKKTLRQPDNEQPNVTQKTYAENEGDSAIYIGGTLDGKSKTVLTPPQKPEIVKESQKVEVEPKKEEVKVNNWEPVIEKTKVPEKKPRKERPGNDWLVAKDKPEKELNNAPPDGPTPLKRVQNSIAGVRMHLGQEKKRGDKEKVEKLTKVLESLEKKKKELEAATPGATNDKS